MKKYRVIPEDFGKAYVPRPHESETVERIASILQSNILFIRRRQSKTPDLYIIKTGVRWELKSPLGGGKHTIQNNLREASAQSENIILDLSRAKLSDGQGISRAKEFLKRESSRIKRLKVFTKTGELIDIK